MTAIYSLYIQKNKSNLMLPKVLKEVIKLASVENKQKLHIFISPGYLGTKEKTRKTLTEEVFQMKYIESISVLNSMIKIHSRDYMAELERDYSIQSPLNNLPLANGDKDHRKMIFICELHSNAHSQNKYILPIKKNPTFYTVHGVLIGSSNFSKTTYLKPNKDEADLFMIKSKYIMQYIKESYDNKILISESINNNDPNFLDNIFKDTLDSVLE